MNILVITDIERADIPFICNTLGCIPFAHQDQLNTKNKNNKIEENLGNCDFVTDVYMEGGSNKVVKFSGIQKKNPKSYGSQKTMTVLLRGSNELVLAEASRSLHDAQCVVRSLVKEKYFIAGGGAAEAEASYQLKQYLLNGFVRGNTNAEDEKTEQITGMDAFCIQAFADALEVIPYTLAENAGMKPIDTVTELRKQHATGNSGHGINVAKKKKVDGKPVIVSNMYELNVVQPLLVSTSAIKLATETVCMIMKIDDLIVVA